MYYDEALKVLGEYLETYWKDLDESWGNVLSAAYQALQDCVDVGFTGEDGRDIILKASLRKGGVL